MANKINQISTGDALYIQLDDNPRLTGYSAPLGSLAYWQDTVNNQARLFFKGGLGLNNWNEIQWAWQYNGNSLNNVSFGVFGSTSNKDVQFVRNSNEYLRALEQTQPYAKPVEISLFERNLSVIDVTTKADYDSFGKKIIINQENTTETPLESDRYNLAFQTKGHFTTSTDLGNIDESRNFDSVFNDYVFTKKAERGKSFRTVTPTLGIISFEVFNLGMVSPEMMTFHLKVLIKRDSDKKIIDLDRKFTINCDDFSLQQFSTLMRHDLASYFDFGSDTVDLDLTFQNTSDLYVPVVGNTLSVVLNIFGLDNAETYTVTEWTTVTLLER